MSMKKLSHFSLEWNREILPFCNFVRARMKLRSGQGHLSVLLITMVTCNLDSISADALKRVVPSHYQIDDMLFVSSDRAGQANSAYRWPEGKIPFSFAPGFTRYQRNEIRLAMDYIQEFTCIRFHSRVNKDENYLHFRNLEGKCSSFVGNIRRGPQQVALDPKSRKCSQPNFPGHVLHELVHAIGFFHEHARNDRDGYIKVIYDNLPADSRTKRNYNTNKENNLEAHDFGVPYNYGSIMHYSNKAGSINGEETIVRRKVRGKPQPLDGVMGQRVKLSYGDIKMIQSMYRNECSESINLNDIPDTDDIPELEDWMEDRMLAMETMPDMPIEEINEESEGIIDEVDNNAADSASTVIPGPKPSTTEHIASTTPTMTTRKPRMTTTRRTRRTTKRSPIQITTTETVTKTPNLYNLLQYFVQNAIKAG